MQTLDFNKPILDLAGKALEQNGEEVTLGKLLAGTLVSQGKGDALKLFGWAQRLYAGTPLTLDKSDVKTLRELIEQEQTLTVLSKAQMLDVFEHPLAATAEA